MPSEEEPKQPMETTITEPAREPAGSVPTLRATELLGRSGVVHIDLDGEIYTLRLTRNRRLILTK